ncbi:MAG: TonB-dependent receptor [Bacteroidales bacterium]|nr:TonB-dependent receptor [Bacteroidales bacterium]
MMKTKNLNNIGLFKITKRFFFIATTLSILCSFTLRSQSGNLSGIITDIITGERLPGAGIYIEELGMGAISNNEGEYKILNIPEGTHTVTFSYLSYLTEKHEVTIKKGETSKLDIGMAYDIVKLGEVIVTSQLLGQARAVNQQLNSDAIVSVVSSDKIKELPDANAAEAIGRLPGISVQRVGGEADKVVIRGLSPKLTAITINGVRVSSTSGTDRSVSLNMISPELLSSIEVFKSPTADMDGDAIGGIVNLGVMKAPEKPEATISVNGGYSSLDQLFGNYKGSVDLSKRFFEKKLGVYVKANYENTNRSSESVSNKYFSDDGDNSRWPVKSSRLQDNQRIINRIGSSAGFDYLYNSGEVSGLVFYSLRKTDIKRNENFLDEGTIINHLPNHRKYDNSVIQGMLSGKQQLKFVEMAWSLSSNKTISDNYYNISVELNEYDGQLVSGDVFTTEEKLAQRTFSYSNAWLGETNYRPEITKQHNYTAGLDFKIDFNLPGKLSGFIKFGGKYRYDQRTHDMEQYSITQYYADDNLNDIAAQNMLPYVMERGGTTNRKIMLSNFISGTDQLGIWNNEYFVAPMIDMDFLDLWYESQKGELHEHPDRTQEYKEYEVHETVAAEYFMVKLKYGEWLNIIPGIRYEHSDNDYLGYFSSVAIDGSGFKKDSTVYKNYGELLPGMHIKIKPVKWFDMRFSAVKTISRPDYDMITPRTRVDMTNGILYRANPDLKHAEAWNFDAILSFFTNKLGLFSIGGFYKKFDNYFAKSDGVMSPEEALSHGYPALAYDVRENYINFNDSKVYGFEVDIQTNLDYLPSPFNGIVMSLNVTRLWSETFFPQFHKIEYYNPVLRRTVIDYDSSFYEFNKTNLPDQTEWISNFVIGYDYKGFSARISTIYQAASLKGFSSVAELGGSKFTEKYTDDFLRMDISLSQKIGSHLTIRANLANITGENEREYQYKEQYWTSENRYGMTIDLGIQYKFF